MKIPSTYLFVPGNRPERFSKALGAGADAVILDLEDAVAPADKASARAEIAQWLAAQDANAAILVRINNSQSPWFAEDLAWLPNSGVRGVMLPKAESAADIAAVVAALPAGAYVVPLIESARGINNANALASAPSVQRLAFGTLDYAVDMDLSGDERGLLVPSTLIALASRGADIATPVAGVTPAIDDEAAILHDLNFERALGFGAKLCIHPRQLALVQRALMPSEEEIAWAKRVEEAVASGAAVVQVDGKMVDKPVIIKAESILARVPK